MSQYTSYYLYQKYEKRGEQDWIPCYPNTYSISGDVTNPMSLVVKSENDTQCGYTPTPTEPMYRWVNLDPSTDYYCDGVAKYYKQQRQVSYDGGTTWSNLDEYQRGSQYEASSSDCGGGTTMYRWVNLDPSTDYYCSGTTKYYKQQKQVSYDNGTTWTNVIPIEYQSGSLYEYLSLDCGYIPSTDFPNQYLTFVAEEDCTFQIKKTGDAYKMYYSLDGGDTWVEIGSSTNTPTVKAGKRIMWKYYIMYTAGNHGSTYRVGNFSSSGRFRLEGNIMSLYNGAYFRGVTSFYRNSTSFNRFTFSYLFENCTKLTNIDNLILPVKDVVQGSYKGMFKGCTSLVTIPYDLLENGTSVRGGSNSQTFEGAYEDMFNGCTSLTTAPELPAIIIGRDCYRDMFNGCTSLTTAPELPARALAWSCYQGMFNGCTSLTTAPVLPARTLENWCYQQMFYGCTSLNNITCLATDISANNCTYNWVSNVAASGTFAKTVSMESWTIGDNGIPSNWSIIDSSWTPTPTGATRVYSTYGNGDIFFTYCDSSTELTTRETKPNGYEYTSMTTAEIGDCITSIGQQAFKYCTSLSSITLPNSVTSIGSGAFYGCTSLSSITIPDSVTSIGQEAFTYCRSLTSCTIGSGVTSIGNSAFYYCSGLKSIDIPDSVTSIGDSAFQDCRSLTSIDIPSGVTSIGSGAFYNCSGLTSVTVNAVTPPTLGGDLVFMNTNNCPIYVACQSVPSYKSAWSSYTSRIQGIPPCEEPTPTGVTKIQTSYSNGDFYFKYCDSSSELTREETRPSGYEYTSMTTAEIGDCITSIGQQAFKYCTSLSSITLPNSVTSIGGYAFYYCSGLKSIDIPDSVTSIGDYAFRDCSSLSSVTIGSGVTSIGNSAFYYCSGLKSIDIPDSVTSIGTSTFFGCSGLTSCTIGSGVTSIDNSAFRNCRGLTSVTVNAVTPPTLGGDLVFLNTNDCPIYVPAESLEAYKSATNWSSYASRIQPII